MYKLGLKGHKVDERGRTLKLSDFMVKNFSVPAHCDVMDGLVPDRADLGNSELGVCALAGPGHFERREAQLHEQFPLATSYSIHEEYKNFGYVVGKPETDQGCYALDVMKRWRKVGLFGGHKIDAFANVDYFDRTQILTSISLLGGWFACFNLPISVEGKDVWDVPDHESKDWGPHLVWMHSESLCNSWGERIYVTDRFIKTFCFDGYAVVSKGQLVNGKTTGGIDFASMVEALKVVTG
jgi:hypothetical protein